MLAGWKKYRAITISTANVDADLTNYPVYLCLSAAGGIGDVDLTSIFTELGSNSLKLAVADATDTECYVEVVSWDAVTPYAELWVNVPAVSGAADTVLTIYYDATHADNSSYVGVTGSVPAKAVWDANYVEVLHENDGVDSSHTTGSKTGTSYVTSATEVAGLIGKGQRDGTISLGNIGNFSASWSLEFYHKRITWDTSGNWKTSYPLVKWNFAGGTPGWAIQSYYAWGSGHHHIYFNMYNGGGYDLEYDWNPDWSVQTNGAFITWVKDSTANTTSIYNNGAAIISNLAIADNSLANGIGMTVIMGSNSSDSDEVRISDIARSAAYIKANNYCFTDALVTFGAEKYSRLSAGKLYALGILQGYYPSWN